MTKNFHLEPLIALLPMFWIFSATLTSSDAHKTLVAIVVFSFLISCWLYGWKPLIQHFLADKWLHILTITIISASFFKGYNDGAPSSMIRAYACMLVLFIALPISLTFKVFKHLHWCLLLAGFSCFIYSILHVYIWHAPRELWDINAIPFSATAAAITICSFIYTQMSSSQKVRAITLVSFTLSFNAVIISQTRGTLLALLVSSLLILMIIHYKKNFHFKRFLIVIFFVCSTLAVNADLIYQRIEATKNEVSTIESGNKATSIGVRLQLWKSSIYLIAESPWLGLGEKHKQFRESMVQNGQASKDILRWTHYHNQYIDRLVKNGIVGFTLLILLLIYPLTQIKKLDLVPSLILIGTVSTFSIAALTDVPFSHPQTIIIFVTLISLCLTQKSKVSTDISPLSR